MLYKIGSDTHFPDVQTIQDNFLAEINKLQPELLLVEVRFIELIHSISIPCIVYSENIDTTNILRAFQNGARGFVTSEDDLVKACKNVVAGNIYIDPDLGREVIEKAYLNSRVRIAKREIELITLYSQGHSVNEIADILILDKKTVRNYLSKVKKYLNK